MFIICKNDFPHSVCPAGTSRDCAEGLAQYHQNECGLQIGLAHKDYFHVVEVDMETIDPLERTPEELNTIPAGATFGKNYRRVKMEKSDGS